MLMMTCICLVNLPLNGFAESKQDSGLSTIDLRDWNREHPSIYVKGKWDFYWQRLLTPDDFISEKSVGKTGTMEIPGPWKDVKAGDTELTSKGVATYRTRILLPSWALHTPMVLEVHEQPMAYRIWVNGQMIISSGTIADRHEESIVSPGKRWIRWTPEKDEIDVVIQGASYFVFQGGTWATLQIHSVDHFYLIHRHEALVSGFVVGGLLLIAIYHFIIFALQPTVQAPLYFAIFCFIVGIRTMIIGEGEIIYDFFDNLPWWLVRKLEYLGYYFGLPVFVAFMRSLYPKEMSRKITNLVWIIGTAATIFMLIAPFYYTTFTLTYYQAFTLAVVVWSTASFVRTIKHRRVGSGILIIGILVIAYTVIYDTLVAHNIIPNKIFIFHYGLMVFVLCQSTTIAMTFYTAFVKLAQARDKIKLLNQHLEQLVEKRTETIAMIINNVRSGFLLINPSFRVQEG
ncbi:MAG: 7TM-DISM domain-containing protein, partial [Oligoflexales bacterium]|nr:7TM-DISM domain-containing protein [Oligoflexales bacterium]